MTKRIEFIDAMRGFTMILVVMRHVYGFGYTQFLYTFNSFNEFFALFRMPLFFFVSGYILYGTSRKWMTTKDCFRFVVKKMKIQLIPTAVFALSFLFLFDVNVRDFLFDTSKAGYWFTIALFVFFCLYAAHHLITERWLHLPGVCRNVLLISFAFLCYVFCSHYAYDALGAKCYGFTSIHNIQYYVFFIFGFFIKKYYVSIEHLLDSMKGATMLVILFFLLSLPYSKGLIGGGNTLIDSVLRLVIGMLGIMTVFSFFRKYELSVTNETALGRVLQYIGRRTLDIYLLHYFFIPRNLPMIGEFFRQNDNPSIEFALTAIIALVVISICLVVSNVIRISPFLAHHLFGVKYAEKKYIRQ